MSVENLCTQHPIPDEDGSLKQKHPWVITCLGCVSQTTARYDVYVVDTGGPTRPTVGLLFLLPLRWFPYRNGIGSTLLDGFIDAQASQTIEKKKTHIKVSDKDIPSHWLAFPEWKLGKVYPAITGGRALPVGSDWHVGRWNMCSTIPGCTCQWCCILCIQSIPLLGRVAMECSKKETE